MADLNAWTARQKAAELRALRSEVEAMRDNASSATAGRVAGQKHMASRVLRRLDERIAELETTHEQ